MKTYLPLISSDFSLFDKTPDDKLYLGELDSEAFDLLVWRYIYTENKDVRDEYRSKMTDPLWDAVREKIKKINEAEGLESNISERINYILNFEFPDAPLTFSASSEYVHTSSLDDSGQYSLFKASDSVNGSLGLTLRAPVNDYWQVYSGVSVVGRHHDENQSERVQTSENANDYQYQSVMPVTAVRLTSSDDRYKVSLDASWDHYFNAPPDHSSNTKMLSASTQARDINIFTNPASFTARFDYLKGEFTPPPEGSPMFQRGSDSKTGFAEFTYKLPEIGFVMAYAYTDSKTTEQFAKFENGAHSFSLLTQLTSEKNYLRIGAGGGIWNGASLIYGEAETNNGDGAEIHQSMIGQIVASSNLLRVVGSVNIYERKTEGTFNGWYPAVISSVTGILTPKHFEISLDAKYEGHRIDLNNKQILQQIGSTLTINYTPMDSLLLALSPGYIYKLTEGYQENTVQIGFVTSSVAYSLPFLQGLRVLAGGTLFYYGYESPSQLISGDIQQVNIGLSYQQ